MKSVKRLANFQSLFNDAVEQVRSAHTVTLRWTPVESLDVDRLGTELEQVQSFYEACEPLTVLLNNLDRQLVQFRDSAVTIDPGVITQQTALRNDFDQVRLITESRIHAINQTIASLRAPPQRVSTLTRTPSHRQTQAPGVRTPIQDGAQGAVTISPPLVKPTVPLSDSVSSPWERCVHPSGTQVPYYRK
ncbi:unnamed protein product [Echinostoma caproni]|uniref:Syntaxin-6_N domain-containing protein n=1 Tax=Echinostoma caproni TaxID=27848 RepID=A0A183B4X8_9TREM|nr:unnamed protein product [Echinostoma caproni]